nr:hypothetical protein [Tanacetum cinerariifolium]
RQDVAKQVSGHNYVELLGLADQLHAHVVDDAVVVERHLGVLGGGFARGVKHQLASVFEDIAFVSHRHVLAAVLRSISKCCLADFAAAFYRHAANGVGNT